jgi:hypothetical protein
MSEPLRFAVEITAHNGTRWTERSEELLMRDIGKFVEAAAAFRSEGPYPSVKVVKLDALIVEQCHESFKR